jgi:FtsP/CotA-like multicopper oxidase with cupredoxin domain
MEVITICIDYSGLKLINPVGQHPFHIHGKAFTVCDYSFVNAQNQIISRTKADLDQKMFAPCGLLSNNWKPVKRDIITVSPATEADASGNSKNGYAVFRFKADIPGVWLMHCHIE